MHAMKSKKPLLLAAALAGLYAGSVTAHAASIDSAPIVAGDKEKESCGGKEKKKEKDGCSGKDHEKKDKKEKKDKEKEKEKEKEKPEALVACDKDKDKDKTKQA
jgi:hypothetical protein